MVALAGRSVPGIFQVTPATAFMTDAEIIPTVLHTMKGQLLSACRACSVNVDCVLRIFVDDSKDTGRITASLYSWCYEEGHGKRSIVNDGTLENSTDKHKVMWLCPVDLLRGVVGQGIGHSGPGSAASSSSGPASAGRTNLAAEDVWTLGTLHILQAGPQTWDSWRLKFLPATTRSDDYVAILLQWSGDVVFQHAALQRAAQRGGDILGVLRPLLKVTIPRECKLKQPENLFRGKIPLAKINEILQARPGTTISLSRDQIACVEYANTTNNPIIKTTALAGTGKTMLVGVMLEAFLQHLPKNGAIFLLSLVGHCETSMSRAMSSLAR